MDNRVLLQLSDVFHLYDDESYQEKLPFMHKWDILMDDGRNPGDNWADLIEEKIVPGKSYKITITVEEESCHESETR